MQPATRTPEGEPNRCSVCGKEFRLEPSRPPGDAPCPNCGSLMWFVPYTVDISNLTDAAKCDALLVHARGLTDKGKPDYAVAILRALAMHAPHRLDYRKALWKALRRSGGFQTRTTPPNVLGRRLLAEAKQKGDWNSVEEVIDICLVYEPLDPTLHLDLGDF